MDPLEPWIDASAVRRMAENLLTAPRGAAVDPGPDAGFGTEFEGFAGELRAAAVALVSAPASRPVDVDPTAPVPSHVPEAPARTFTPAAVVVVAPAAAEPAPVAVAAPAPGQERRGPLLERLARFRDQLIRHTGAQGVFILDREGKPVMEDPAFGKLHFLARSLAQAYRPVAGQAGNVHVKIGSNAVLEVVPVDTPFGCLVLGTVMPRPLTAAAVAEIAAALRQAAKPREA